MINTRINQHFQIIKIYNNLINERMGAIYGCNFIISSISCVVYFANFKININMRLIPIEMMAFIATINGELITWFFLGSILFAGCFIGVWRSKETYSQHFSDFGDLKLIYLYRLHNLTYLICLKTHVCENTNVDQFALAWHILYYHSM